jgi:hypothetical protein
MAKFGLLLSPTSLGCVSEIQLSGVLLLFFSP